MPPWHCVLHEMHMDATFTPNMLMVAGAIALIIVLLGGWYFYRRAASRAQHHRFGVDHNQAITEMGNRTRAEAERKQRELRGEAAPPTAP